MVCLLAAGPTLAHADHYYGGGYGGYPQTYQSSRTYESFRRPDGSLFSRSVYRSRHGNRGHGWEGPAIIGGAMLVAVIVNRLLSRPQPGSCAPDDYGCRRERGYAYGAYEGRVRTADNAEREAWEAGFRNAYPGR